MATTATVRNPMKNRLSNSELLRRIDKRNLHRWIAPFARRRLRELAMRRQSVSGTRHLMFALCDHYEPLWKQPGGTVGDDRVRAWEEGYPKAALPFRDADGRAPQHSFFFAAEEYQPSYLERLTRIVEQRLGEVELHLHHENDSSASLRAKLVDYLGLLAKHGHLSRDSDGALRFAFIHGNWCLANSRPDGRHCGVDDELALLFDEGCYADFTFPSAPDITQPAAINQIYWPAGDIRRRAAHEYVCPAEVGTSFSDRPLMIQGPLGMTWDRARNRPRIENGALTGQDPPTGARVDTWVRQNIHIDTRPDWVFVKVHTHGAVESTAQSLLGAGGTAMHAALQRYNDGSAWKLHYVTAREMTNIAFAALDGHTGDPHEFRDYRLAPPPVLQ